MRIIFVTSKINLETAGGSVTDLDLKVRDMQALGAQVKVITIFSDLNRLPQLPYQVIEEHIPVKTFLRVQSRVVQIMRAEENDTDVFHIEGQFCYGGSWYRVLGGKPVVIFYNRETFSWGKNGTLRRFVRHHIEKLLNQFLVPSIDHFIFTTPQLAARYAKFGLHLRDEKRTIQPDYVDQEKVREAAKDNPPATRGDTIRIFASGRMVKEKGFDLLIDALVLLPKEILECLSVTMSGNGPEREVLIQHAGSHGLSNTIVFPGWLPKEEMYRTLARADIFVLPKWHLELSSVLLFEAMILGIPSIVAKGGGLAWLSGEGAETFEDSNPASLAQAIETLMTPGERMRRSEAARVRMREFDHRRMASALFALLRDAALNPA